MTESRSTCSTADALGTILFDLEVVDALMLYREWAVELQAAFTQIGGHGAWVASERDALAFLSNGELRANRVSSSIGLEDAVWTTTMNILMSGLSQHCSPLPSA